MSCNFLNSSWMQDEDIHYADALFPLIHTRVNDSFVSVSAPDDRAAVLHAETAGSTDAVWTLTRRCRGRGYCWELHTSISIDWIWILSSIILSSRYKLCASVCSSLFSSITNGCWWEQISRFGISAISAAADEWEIGCKHFLQPFLLCSTIHSTLAPARNLDMYTVHIHSDSAVPQPGEDKTQLIIPLPCLVSLLVCGLPPNYLYLMLEGGGRVVSISFNYIYIYIIILSWNVCK